MTRPAIPPLNHSQTHQTQATEQEHWCQLIRHQTLYEPVAVLGWSQKLEHVQSMYVWSYDTTGISDYTSGTKV